jgi:hypothetical protein
MNKIVLYGNRETLSQGYGSIQKLIPASFHYKKNIMFKWIEGRQKSGYFKMKLAEFSWPFGFDTYLLKFETGVSVPEHIDPVTGKKHYRMNLTIRNPISGGTFVCENSILNLPRLKLFRPDKYKHSLTTVEGTLIMLSIGVAI